MPVQTRSQTKKNAAAAKHFVSRPVVAIFNQETREMKEYNGRLDWFKKYCKKTLDLCHAAKPGMEKLRIANELFFVVDEYFYEILSKERKNDRYLRFACVVYKKAFELYCEVEEIMEKHLKKYIKI
jgi:hypothetical protein